MKKLLRTVFLFIATATAQAQPAAPRLRIVENLRLDGASEQFTAIDPTLVQVGADGRIMIWDGTASQILVFDAAGKRVATFGRRGQGPGEFGNTVRTGLVGDTLWVYDLSQRRFTLVGPDTKLVRAFQIPQPLSVSANLSSVLAGNLVRPVPVALHADGSFTAAVQLIAAGAAPGAGGARVTHYVAVSPNGVVTRVIGVPPVNRAIIAARITPPAGSSQGAMMVVGAVLPGGGTAARAERAYAPSGTRLGLLETRMASGPRGTIILTVLRTGGDTVFSKSYPFNAIPMSRAVEDSIVATLHAELRDTARSRMNGQYSPVSALVLGVDGGTWLQKHALKDGVECVMLDERGNPVSSVLLPRGAELLQATKTAIWTIERDADDVPSIVRYRVMTAR